MTDKNDHIMKHKMNYMYIAEFSVHDDCTCLCMHCMNLNNKYTCFTGRKLSGLDNIELSVTCRNKMQCPFSLMAKKSLDFFAYKISA